MPLIAVPLEAAPANASPRQRRAAVVFGLLALGALGALLVTQPVAGDESQRLTTDTADEKLSHHHAPSPPPFPFATSAFVFDGTASRRCIEMAISGCPPDHSAVVESFGPWKKCCPTPTPPGTCYHSDRCFADCADGFGEPACPRFEVSSRLIRTRPLSQSESPLHSGSPSRATTCAAPPASQGPFGTIDAGPSARTASRASSRRRCAGTCACRSVSFTSRGS